MTCVINVPLSVSAAEKVQEGVKVTLNTESASSNKINANLIVENTNTFNIENINLQYVIPDGYKLSKASKSKLSLEELAASEKVELKVQFIPNGMSEGSGVTLVNTSNTTKSSGGNKTGNSSTSKNSTDAVSSPKTGDEVGYWVITLLLAGGTMIITLKLDKKKKSRLLSLLLCCAIGGQALPELMKAKAAEKDLSGSISIEELLDETPIKADVSYVLPDGTSTVYFDSNRGSKIESQLVERRGLVKLPEEAPIREGYEFLGWYHNGVPYDFNTPVTDDMVLIAMWLDTEQSGNEGETNLDDNNTFVDSDPLEFGVSGLKVDKDSRTIYADVNAPDNCILLVRFIDEDIYFSDDFPNNKAYISDDLYASHVVKKGTTDETISADIKGSLPEYFVAEAVLIGTDGNPLTTFSVNIDNTHRHKEFESKTIYDFEGSNLVVNFDEDESNNFGVIADDVKVVLAGKVDREYIWKDDVEIPDSTYTIFNPSEEMFIGDKIYITDGETDNIFKIGDIIENEDGSITVIPVKATDEENGYSLSEFYKFLKVNMQIEGENLYDNVEENIETTTENIETTEESVETTTENIEATEESIETTTENIETTTENIETTTENIETTTENIETTTENIETTEASVETTTENIETTTENIETTTENIETTTENIETTEESIENNNNIRLNTSNIKTVYSGAPSIDLVPRFPITENLIKEEGKLKLRLLDVDGTASASIPIEVRFPKNTDEDNYIQFTGKLSTTVVVVAEYDVVLFGESYIDISTSLIVDKTFTVDMVYNIGNIAKSIELGEYDIPTPVVGLSIYLKPSIEFELNLDGKLNVEINSRDKSSLEIKSGYEINKKSNNWFTSTIYPSADFSASVGLKVGIGMSLAIGVAEIGGSVGAGVKAEASLAAGYADGGEWIHACSLCLTGSLSKYVDLDLEISIGLKDIKIINKIPGLSEALDKVTWKQTINLLSLNDRMFYFYKSLINGENTAFHGEQRFGKFDKEAVCPNKLYRTFFSIDGMDIPVPYAVNMSIESKDINESTTKNGSNEVYTYDLINVRDAGLTQKSGNLKTDLWTYTPTGTFFAYTIYYGQVYGATFTVSENADEIVVLKPVGDIFEGGIEGAVVDDSTGKPIVGATIKIFKDSTEVQTLHSDVKGKYSMDGLHAGKYKIVIDAVGYTEFEKYFEISWGQKRTIEATLMAKEDANQIMGGVHGKITDAATGRGVSDAHIEVYKGSSNLGDNQDPLKTITTDASGNYSLDSVFFADVAVGLDTGNYTLVVTKDGYITGSFNVTITGAMNKEANYPITPEGMADNFYRIVLSWGETPADLDIWLMGNSLINNDTYSYEAVSWGYKVGRAASLDVDDRGSYGPETIRIPDISKYGETTLIFKDTDEHITSGAFLLIHNYSDYRRSNSNRLSTSGAKVEVYKGTELIREYSVPYDVIGNIWWVFGIDADGNIIDINDVSNRSYGFKGVKLYGGSTK